MLVFNSISKSGSEQPQGVYLRFGILTMAHLDCTPIVKSRLSENVSSKKRVQYGCVIVERPKNVFPTLVSNHISTKKGWSLHGTECYSWDWALELFCSIFNFDSVTWDDPHIVYKDKIYCNEFHFNSILNQEYESIELTGKKLGSHKSEVLYENFQADCLLLGKVWIVEGFCSWNYISLNFIKQLSIIGITLDE